MAGLFAVVKQAKPQPLLKFSAQFNRPPDPFRAVPFSGWSVRNRGLAQRELVFDHPQVCPFAWPGWWIETGPVLFLSQAALVKTQRPIDGGYGPGLTGRIS